MHALTICIDPLARPEFEHYDDEWFMEQVGYIPAFLQAALSDTTQPLGPALNEAYQHGGGPMTGGTYEEGGVYNYPEDPPLYPLAAIECARGTVYVYLYGIVSIHENGNEPIMYRMD